MTDDCVADPSCFCRPCCVRMAHLFVSDVLLFGLPHLALFRRKLKSSVSTTIPGYWGLFCRIIAAVDLVMSLMCSHYVM